MENNQDVVDNTPNEQPIVEAGEVKVIDTTPKDVRFSISIHQKDEDGKVCVERGMSFELPTDSAVDADMIVGTAFDRIFGEMDLAKAFGSKFLSTKLPIYLKIESDSVSIDYGKLQEWAVIKLKANSSARSKLALLERCIVATTSMLRPVNGVKAVQLTTSLKQEAMDKNGKKVREIASVAQLTKLAQTVLVVEPTGKLIETKDVSVETAAIIEEAISA